ncbi:hypothetical protein HX860_05715 [Marine Group I thaumarchaeote]|uniref:Uncharacterized protein n=1 Tax=Marine Group I thaumarchaeote TaxID=2511932 RepID=A0A7K4NJK4_9ARCH|nr:hypothetical protein [Candidatus Nitrosopumilus sp. MTA1]NWJ20545.1 hypothetical protein [Marine Group I thaumarchaeote]NWJ28649.1 hypothetical protein [Marine Group I thaumarchaeote]NWJ56548.1 hypothetical protein [Marine Group I thaumarchaeote]NWJ83183.1 hypothetical protein [Marine Group I thaumarchaeote]
MARFKKKKSKPISESDDSKKESVKEVSVDIPETEKLEPASEIPLADPPISEAAKSEKDRKLSKLYWMRIALAIISGAAATFLFEDIEGEERRWTSIAFMIILFIGSIVVAKSMKMQLPSSDRKKIVTQALGSYVFLYLFIWILTNTIVNVGTVTNGMPSLLP